MGGGADEGLSTYTLKISSFHEMIWRSILRDSFGIKQPVHITRDTTVCRQTHDVYTRMHITKRQREGGGREGRRKGREERKKKNLDKMNAKREREKETDVAIERVGSPVLTNFRRGGTGWSSIFKRKGVPKYRRIFEYLRPRGGAPANESRESKHSGVVSGPVRDRT